MTNAFPVDVHIYRVTKRFGWVPENATYEKAQQVLGELIPPDRYYCLHINLTHTTASTRRQRAKVRGARVTSGDTRLI